MLKLNIGSGKVRREGYRNVDVRALHGVDIVANAWSLPLEPASVQEIYSRHMIEHLTFAQAADALREWHRVLIPSGRLHLICPNRDYHLWQLLSPTRHSEFVPYSNLQHGLAGFHGWQDDEYDVHKSSWTYESLCEAMTGLFKPSQIMGRACDIELIAEKL